MSPERLQQLMQSGTEQDVVAFFQGMPEKSRREYFPAIKAAWNQARRNRIVEVEPGTLQWNPSLKVVQTAFFATATFSEVKQAKWMGRPPEDDVMFTVLDDRRPNWIDPWIETLLGES